MKPMQGCPLGREAYSECYDNNFPPLTGNQQMIYSALRGLKRAAKAYELLDILRENGVRAAPTVYRALHELEEKGLVQHLVSSRSFFALKSYRPSKTEQIMLVCNSCQKAVTAEDKAFISAVKSNAHDIGFEIRSYHLELSVCCDNCESVPSAPS